MTGGAGSVIRQRSGHRLRSINRRAAQPVGLALGRGPRHRPTTCSAALPLQPLGGSRSRRPLTSFGPGVDVSFPNDPYLLPFMELEQAGAPSRHEGPDPDHE